jgi:hypothetical protein
MKTPTEFNHRVQSGTIDLDLIAAATQKIELNIATCLPNTPVGSDGDCLHTSFNLLTGKIKHRSGENIPADVLEQLQQLHIAQIETIQLAIQSQMESVEVVEPRANSHPPNSYRSHPETKNAATERQHYSRERILVTATPTIPAPLEAIDEEWESWDETKDRPAPKSATATIASCRQTTASIPDWEEHWLTQQDRTIEPTLVPAPATIIDGSATTECWEKFTPECVGFNTPGILPDRRHRQPDVEDLEEILASLTSVPGIRRDRLGFGNLL